MRGLRLAGEQPDGLLGKPVTDSRLPMGTIGRGPVDIGPIGRQCSIPKYGASGHCRRTWHHESGTRENGNLSMAGNPVGFPVKGPLLVFARR